MVLIRRRGCFVGVDIAAAKDEEGRRDGLPVGASIGHVLNPKKGFGDLSYLIRWLNKQNLPGEAPADWVVMLLKIAERDGRSVYVYDEDGPDQWTVTLTRTGLKVLPAS